MRLLLFIYLSFLCFLPDTSIANDNNSSKALATKIEILLKTNIKYIDKKNDPEKVSYSIMFEVFFINKTKQDLVISSDDNNLKFFVNYKSTQSNFFLKRLLGTLPNLDFSAGGTATLKASSYTKMEFEYPILEHALKQYIKSDKYNIFQGWCEFLSTKKIKSNIVNIPIISHSQQGKISNKNHTLHKSEPQAEKFSSSAKHNNHDIIKLKANGDVFINGEKIEISKISNKLQEENAIVFVFFDKGAIPKDVIAVLKQIAKSSVFPILKFGEMPK